VVTLGILASPKSGFALNANLHIGIKNGGKDDANFRRTLLE